MMADQHVEETNGLPQDINTPEIDTQIELSVISDPIIPSNPLSAPPVAAESKSCSFCLEAATPNAPLIRSCKCRTCHRSCLDEWRAYHRDDKFFHECEICRFQYIYEPIGPQNDAADIWNRFILYSVMGLSGLGMIAVSQAGAALCAYFCRACDPDQNLANSISSDPWLSYWIYGNILFFFIIGLMMIVNQACCDCTPSYSPSQVYSYRPPSLWIINCCDCRGGGGGFGGGNWSSGSSFGGGYHHRHRNSGSGNDCCGCDKAGDACIWIAVVILLAIAVFGAIVAVSAAVEWMTRLWWRYNQVFTKRRQAHNTFRVKDINEEAHLQLEMASV